MPFRQVAVYECIQRPFLIEQRFAMRIQFCSSRLQGFFHQFILGFEMRIEPAVRQVQSFHQGLQPGGPNPVAAKAYGGFLDDALVSLGFMVC